jgi:multidrug efflux pump subunit AcrA (membrane-fusion protein)
LIDLEPPEGVELREGMTALASIVTRRVEGALLVPSRAVSWKGGRSTVSVLVEGEPRERPVSLGANDGTYSEVLSGLKEGDIVLVRATQPAALTRQISGATFRALPGMGPGPGIPRGGGRGGRR